jgi:hypothetical protein
MFKNRIFIHTTSIIKLKKEYSFIIIHGLSYTIGIYNNKKQFINFQHGIYHIIYIFLSKKTLDSIS